MIKIASALTMVAALLLNGCWFRSKPKPTTPPPPVQAPRATQTTKPSTPARKSPAKRRRVPSAPRAGQPAAIPPKAAEPKKSTPAPESEELPRFGQILTAEESAAYRSRYERSAAAAQEILQMLPSLELTPDGRASRERILSFLAQAREAVASDPPAAAHLANRAEVLARDLARSLL